MSVNSKPSAVFDFATEVASELGQKVLKSYNNLFGGDDKPLKDAAKKPLQDLFSEDEGFYNGEMVNFRNKLLDAQSKHGNLKIKRIVIEFDDAMEEWLDEMPDDKEKAMDAAADEFLKEEDEEKASQSTKSSKASKASKASDASTPSTPSSPYNCGNCGQAKHNKRTCENPTVPKAKKARN